MRWLVGLLCVGCYSPTFSAGSACDTECPGDLVCMEHVCREAGYMPGIDAGPRDAADATPVDTIDGPPGDADADGINDLTDNCPAKGNADQHDEDGDVIGDVCDPCPHLSGNASDGDADGVGDACDPQPAIAKQTIKFFDPFTTDRPEWGSKTSASRLGETMRFNGQTYAGAVLSAANGESRIYVGGTIASIIPGASEHQVTIAFGRNASGSVYHYTEFYDTSGSTGDIAISRANQGSYTLLAATSYSGQLPTGAWSMQIDASVAQQKINFATTLGGVARAPISANLTTTPLLAASTTMQVDVNSSDVRFDYFLVIETLP
jgi:hypothetical protein